MIIRLKLFSSPAILQPLAQSLGYNVLNIFCMNKFYIN